MSSRRLAISSLLNEDEQQDLDKEKEKDIPPVVTGLDVLVHAASQLPSISTFDPAAPQPKKRRHSDTLHDHATHTMGPGVPPYRERDQQRPLSMEGRRPQLMNQYPEARNGMLIDQYPRSTERVRSPVFPRPVQERILSPPHERLPHTLDSHRFAVPSPTMSMTSSRDFVSPKLSARDFAREGRDQVGIDHSRERSSDIGLLRESSRERRDSVPSRDHHPHHLPREHQFIPSGRDIIIGPRDGRDPILSPTASTSASREHTRELLMPSASTSRDPLREQLAREREQHLSHSREHALREPILSSPPVHTVSPFTQYGDRRSSITQSTLPRQSLSPFPQFTQTLIGPGTSSDHPPPFMRQSPSPFPREPSSLSALSRDSHQREDLSPFSRESSSSARQSPSPFPRDQQPIPPIRDSALSRDRYLPRESTSRVVPPIDPYQRDYPPERSDSSTLSRDSQTPYFPRDTRESFSHRDTVSPRTSPVFLPRDHPGQTIPHPREPYPISPKLSRHGVPEMSAFPPSLPRDVDLRAAEQDMQMSPFPQQSTEFHQKHLPSQHSPQLARESTHHYGRPSSVLNFAPRPPSAVSSMNVSPPSSIINLPRYDSRSEFSPHEQLREDRIEQTRTVRDERPYPPVYPFPPSHQSPVLEHQPHHRSPVHPPEHAVRAHSPSHSIHRHRTSPPPPQPTHISNPSPFVDASLPVHPPPARPTHPTTTTTKRLPPGSQEGRAHAHRNHNPVEMLDREREKEMHMRIDKERDVKVERATSVLPPTPVVASPVNAAALSLKEVPHFPKEEDMAMDVDRNPSEAHVPDDKGKHRDDTKSKKAKGKPGAKKDEKPKAKEKTSSKKKETKTKDKDKEDAHEWLLEHFADSPASSSTSDKVPRSKLRPSTPSMDMDVDAELEETLMSRAPTPSVRADTPMDVDVDSELLNLITPTSTSTPVPPAPPPASTSASIMPMVLAPPMRKAAMKKLDKDKDRESMPPPPIVKKRAKPAPKAKKAVAEKKAPAEKKGKGKVTERSRSTSAMPVEKEVEDEKDVHEEDDKVEDDRLYCLCRAKYNHDDTMVGCDRCDEWYHPGCVDMADTPLDLVDQFICPPCVMKYPHLNLKTTYKMRCLNGLEDPDRETACPRPARGAVSKYCSQECGVKNMRRRIEAYTAKGGKKSDLWEKVKDAERREGLVVRLGNGHIGKSRTKREREVEKLQTQLDAVSMQRETVKRSMDVALWRERLLELAVGRAEAKQDECGWDQRLCFGEEEWEEFGEGALENYGSSEEEWWCPGPADCDRHVGWQAVRHDDIAHEKEKQEEALMKLTTREREIRKHIEDLSEVPAPLKTNPKVVNGASSATKRNGRSKISKKK